MSKLNEQFWQIDQIKKFMEYLNKTSPGRCLQPIRWERRMGCRGNMYDMLMPSPADEKNRGVREIFQTIFLERHVKRSLTVCEITIEAGSRPGARVLCETYKSDELREGNWIEFPSIDAAVVEAGRLAHNKMSNGFHYRLAAVDTSFRDAAPVAIS
ncbi:MAG: hypothetical protein H5U12_20285 [Hoeflea sp.]|nr:hypothetical protein [Hoeflea sp.]